MGSNHWLGCSSPLGGPALPLGWGLVRIVDRIGKENFIARSDSAISVHEIPSVRRRQ